MKLKDFYDQLDRTPGVGPFRVRQLLDAGLSVKQIAAKHAKPKEELESAPFLTPACDGYPVAFSQLTAPPLRLFHRGHPIQTLSRPIVGVVGSRRASQFGLNWARKVGTALARNGASVCSGLAIGIDGAAHRGALDECERNPHAGKPVAILGHGWNFLHPPENKKLYQELVDKGTVLTEFPPHQSPAKWTFPARNRLIAALSDHLVVVEAGPKSGSLITARLAGEVGRPVWAVPNAPGRLNSKGVLELLRDGVKTIWDLEEFVESVAPTRRREQEPKLTTLEPRKQMIVELLAESEGEVDCLYNQTNFSPTELAYELTELEIDGLVRRTWDGRWEVLCWDLLGHLNQQVRD